MEVKFIREGHHFLFTAVYAANDRLPREAMWEDIARLSTNVSLPWLVSGDFNTILVYGEKLSDGEPVSFNNSELLQCTSQCNLQDMQFSGVFHTWCNNKDGDQRIYCKLDRSLVNDLWLQAYTGSDTVYKSSAVSDHAFAVISISPVQRPKKSFKFCNMWIDHSNFFDVVQQAWHTRISGVPMYVLVKKLQAVKVQLKGLHRNNF